MTYTLTHEGQVWKLTREPNRHSISYTLFIQQRLRESPSSPERLIANWVRFVRAR